MKDILIFDAVPDVLFPLYHSAELDAQIRNEIVTLPDKQTEQRQLSRG